MGPRDDRDPHGLPARTAQSDRLGARIARAFENFNPQGAHNALDEAFACMSIDAALSEIVLPYLQGIQAGPVRTASAIAQVEFSSSLLETRLLGLASGWDSGGSPTVVIAYLGHDRGILGAIAFGLALRDRGWRICYLGASASAALAAETAQAAGALVVALAAHDTADFTDAGAALRQLDAARHVVLTGPGATAAAARRLGADLLPRHPVAAARELHRRHGSRRFPPLRGTHPGDVGAPT